MTGRGRRCTGHLQIHQSFHSSTGHNAHQILASRLFHFSENSNSQSFHSCRKNKGHRKQLLTAVQTKCPTYSMSPTRSRRLHQNNFPHSEYTSESSKNGSFSIYNIHTTPTGTFYHHSNVISDSFNTNLKSSSKKLPLYM